jgi:hypothetical protein
MLPASAGVVFACASLRVGGGEGRCKTTWRIQRIDTIDARNLYVFYCPLNLDLMPDNKVYDLKCHSKTITYYGTKIK